ncbi:POU domain, class 6, transcription factor 1-like [Ptychodera flava]|uniref:POU domain, class 6, transcription factor 1-like n=1 Tax=Ptychodera flava TaxID=63121 RepID=UPI003969C4B2
MTDLQDKPPLLLLDPMLSAHTATASRHQENIQDQLLVAVQSMDNVAATSTTDVMKHHDVGISSIAAGSSISSAHQQLMMNPATLQALQAQQALLAHQGLNTQGQARRAHCCKSTLTLQCQQRCHHKSHTHSACHHPASIAQCSSCHCCSSWSKPAPSTTTAAVSANHSAAATASTTTTTATAAAATAAATTTTTTTTTTQQQQQQQSAAQVLTLPAASLTGHQLITIPANSATGQPQQQFLTIPITNSAGQQQILTIPVTIAQGQGGIQFLAIPSSTGQIPAAGISGIGASQLTTTVAAQPTTMTTASTPATPLSLSMVATTAAQTMSASLVSTSTIPAQSTLTAVSATGSLASPQVTATTHQSVSSHAQPQVLSSATNQMLATALPSIATQVNAQGLGATAIGLSTTTAGQAVLSQAAIAPTSLSTAITAPSVSAPQLSSQSTSNSPGSTANISQLTTSIPLLKSADTTVAKADGNSHSEVDGVNLEEIREFAKQFKIRRLSLGLTQTQVGQALSATEGPAYSQSAICRFEKLDITPKSAQKIKPVLERWMEEAEERHKNGVGPLTDFVGSEPSKKRKRRTSFTPQALEVLNAYFEKITHPSSQDMTELSNKLSYDREVVRVWFCNKRQALKNTIKKLKSP